MEGTKAGQRSATGETWQVWLFDNLCQPLITGALGGYFHWVAFGGVVALGGYYVLTLLSMLPIFYFVLSFVLSKLYSGW